MYIYKVTCLINNKIYIGLTTNKKGIKERWRKHICEAKFRLTRNSRILNAIRKYGEFSFKIEQIDTANSYEELIQKEINYIAQYNSTDKNIGYNITKGGEGSFGTKMSEQTKEKIRQRHLGKKWSKEKKEKHSIIIKNANTDFSKGKENCLKHNLETSKMVQKFDITGELIEEYQSISEASNKNNIHRSAIIRHIKKGNIRLCKGYIYKIKDK